MKFEELVQNIMGNQNLKSELVKLKSFEEVYDFFRSNGYEGGEKELKENLFSKSAMSEEQLSSVSGGASGRQVLAACASFMMLMGVAPIGTNNAAYAKMPSIISKIFKKSKKADDSNPAKIILEKMTNKKDLLTQRLKDSFQNHGKSQITEQLLDFFNYYTDDMKCASQGFRTGKLADPKLLIFNGELQQEKEEAAKILSQALTDNDPIKINASDIKEYAENKGLSYEDALMYGDIIKEQDNYKGAKNLPDYFKKTKNSVKVIMIDGLSDLYYRELHYRGQERKEYTNDMDEMLRDIVNGNWKDKKGKSVDTSGLVVIFTTNETEASLRGRIKIGNQGEPIEVQLDKDGDSIYDEAGQLVYGLPTKEGNKAIIPHDGSLFNRMAGNIYYFDEN